MLKSLAYVPFLLSGLTFDAIAADKENSVMIPAFNAKYTILRKSKAVGEASRQLTYLANGFAQYSYRTDIEWLIFSDTRYENSVVKLEGNKVTPTSYEYKREGTGSDKYYKWRYDTTKNIAVDEKKNKTKTVNFPENIQDPLSYHLQHRLNLMSNPEQTQFIYPVIKTSGKIKDYVYQYDGEEELMLPYGLVKTIRLKREIVEKERITYAWFAPELDYLLVKLYQIKEGVEQFEAQLNSVVPINTTDVTDKVVSP